MFKILFVGLILLCGVFVLASNNNNGIKLLDTETIKQDDGSTLDAKYYCKEGKVFIHIYGIEGAKDGRLIMPVVWENTRNSDREDPQVLCSEYKDWKKETSE